MRADCIIVDARVLTMDPARPRAGAVAWGGGRILAAGSREEAEAFADAGTRRIDARGRTVLPGFFESHLHIGLGGAELSHLQIGGVKGAHKLAEAVQAFAANDPGLPVILAQGADYALLGRPMTRADLDAVLPDRPLALMAHDHHTVWANTAALVATDLLRGRACPPGHEVVMAPDGTATGELREFEAFAPIMALAGEARLNLGIATGEEPEPYPSEAEMAADAAKVAAGLRHCAAHGITSVVTMDGNRYTLDLLARLRAAGALCARVKVPFHFKPHMDLAALDRASRMARDFDDEWLQSGFVKMFMDGVIDSGTAFMLQDYPGRPGHRGEPLFAPEAFARIAADADRRGLQIAVHAIGDGAVRTVLDGYAAARAANGRRDARHRIEHIELIDRSDIARLAALDVVASLQPPHPPGAMDFPLQPTLDLIGAARWGDAYLCRTLREAGVRVAFASDWPVADVSVLRGVQAAMTRPAYPGGASERSSLMEALHAYTAGGAWAARRDHVTGMLSPGLAADLVMLDGDIEAVAGEEIGALGVAMTVCGGRVTHGRRTARTAGGGACRKVKAGPDFPLASLFARA